MSAPRPLEHLGAAIKVLRVGREMRQGDLATASGVSKTLISSYESGRGNPRVVTLEKLLIGLGADLEDLSQALQRARTMRPTSTRVRAVRRTQIPADAPAAAGRALGDFLGHLANTAR